MNGPNRKLLLCAMAAASVLALRIAPVRAGDKPCSSDGDCKGKQICRDAKCQDANKWCAGQDACAERGMCGFADGRCVPAQAAHCRKSKQCEADGLCTPKDGRCQRGGAADCKRARPCADEGRCTFEDGRCVIGTDADCRGSAGCREAGRCQLDKGRCVAASDADCGRAKGCKEFGYCSFRGGVCQVSTDKDCQQSDICRNQGGCHAIQDYTSEMVRCMPTTDADCTRSKLCKDFKQCMLRGVTCGYTEEYCGKIHDCKVSDKCYPVAGFCVRREDVVDCDDCPKTGKCTPSATEHPDMESEVVSKCIASSDEDCRKSEECRTSGSCALNRFQGECVAGSDADCAASDACKASGLCKAVKGSCVAGSGGAPEAPAEPAAPAEPPAE